MNKIQKEIFEIEQECNGNILTCLNEKCICKHNKIMGKETVEQGFDRIGDSMDFTEFCFPSFKLGVKWEQEQNGLTTKEGIDFGKELSKWGYNKGNSIDVEILVNEILPDLFKQFNK
jgi:hypothetical protein